MHAQTVVLPVIWDVTTLMWRHCNVSYVSSHGMRVKCCSQCLNFSFDRVPAMTSKQKMTNIQRVAKSTSISCDIEENILSFFWSEHLLHRKSNVNVYVRQCINIVAPFFKLFDINWIIWNQLQHLQKFTREPCVLKCIPMDKQHNPISVRAVVVIYNVCELPM